MKSFASSQVALAESEQKQRPEAQSPHYAQKKGPGLTAFRPREPVVLAGYTPDPGAHQQTSPPRLELSPAKGGQPGEEQASSGGVMSSIGLAISAFFGGKGAAEDEERTSQE